MLWEVFFLIAFLVIGLLLGLAALPWWKRRGAASEFAYVRAFVLFWPFLLLDYLWLAVKAYVHAWKRYLHARGAERDKAQQRRPG